MKKISKKTLITIISVTLTVALAVGATFAYLQDASNEKVNIFKKSRISVDLIEDHQQTPAYKIIPGQTAWKDPKVLYDTPDVDAYVFVKVTDETDGLVT